VMQTGKPKSDSQRARMSQSHRERWERRREAGLGQRNEPL
jgi:hypothetical protein